MSLTPRPSHSSTHSPGGKGQQASSSRGHSPREDRSMPGLLVSAVPQADDLRTGTCLCLQEEGKLQLRVTIFGSQSPFSTIGSSPTLELSSPPKASIHPPCPSLDSASSAELPAAGAQSSPKCVESKESPPRKPYMSVAAKASIRKDIKGLLPQTEDLTEDQIPSKSSLLSIDRLGNLIMLLSTCLPWAQP